MIFISNPKAQYQSHKAEIDKAIHKVLESGSYILGKEVRAFEIEFSEYIGANYAIGVGSGTEALHLALKSCGIEKGDEVITISHTAVATIAAIELAGAKPIFVDIEPSTFTMDPNSLKSVITPSAKAIIPVHLYGHPAQMDNICEIARQNGLRVIEDCAQAHGATIDGKRVGSFGDMGCFSFYPTKNLGAVGDGGIVVTNDKSLAKKASLLREYGWAQRFISQNKGWNTRLDEIQAALLRIKLKYLDKDNEARARIAEIYRKRLDGMPLTLPKVSKNAIHAHHLFVIRSKNRDGLMKYLNDNDIGASIHYPVPVHHQPAYEGLANKLPHTETAVKEILSLPIYPELPHDKVHHIINAVKNFLKSKQKNF